MQFTYSVTYQSKISTLFTVRKWNPKIHTEAQKSPDNQSISKQNDNHREFLTRLSAIQRYSNKTIRVLVLIMGISIDGTE